MKTPRILATVAALAVMAFVIRHSSFVIAQGPLTPPGAPAPTMKTLDQLEPRTPISGVTTISTSGSYYLTGNITVASGNAINISADHVTLDLNGFTLGSTASPASGIAVSLTSTRRNVTIKNGHIRGTTTFAAGSFTTGGFLSGIVNITSNSANLRVSDISVLGVADHGINLVTASVPTFIVERCSISVCGGFGIQAGFIRDCAADTTGNTAIAGDIAVNCSGETVNTDVAAASGVSALSNVENCRGISVSGPGVQGINVSNSRGTSTSGNGLNATNALNCEGVSTSGSFGLNANFGTTSFCRARRDGGVAIGATNAIGCTVIGSGTVAAPNKSLGTP